jgi:hypothetical protein
MIDATIKLFIKWPVVGHSIVRCAPLRALTIAAQEKFRGASNISAAASTWHQLIALYLMFANTVVDIDAGRRMSIVDAMPIPNASSAAKPSAKKRCRRWLPGLRFEPSVADLAFAPSWGARVFIPNRSVESRKRWVAYLD